MTRRTAPAIDNRTSCLSILSLSTEGLNRLCNALEIAGLLPAAPNTVSKAYNKANLLNSLQHPKASKLMPVWPEGPQLDLSVLTVKELKVLAQGLKVPINSGDCKAVIMNKIVSDLTGARVTSDKQASGKPESLSSQNEQVLLSNRPASNESSRKQTKGQSQLLPTRQVQSATQHSSDYSTSAWPEAAHATALTGRSQSGNQTLPNNAMPSWVTQQGQQAPVALPHRNQNFLGIKMPKLFGRKPAGEASQKVSQSQEEAAQLAALEQAYASPPALQPANRRSQTQQGHSQKGQTARQKASTKGERQQKADAGAHVDRQRATLEQQWARQEQQKLLEAEQWTSAEMMLFLKDVRHLQSKGKGQSAPAVQVIVERLQFFPDSIQGYEALFNNPSEIVRQGSSEFGSRSGFAMLIRGPEQYLTKGPGYIYVYYLKDVPYEFKVGMSKTLPERHIDSGRLVGRVVDQRKHNRKEYLLDESFPVPHRTLVDEVLKVRLKQWNYSHPDKGDGYTEWFRSILVGDLKDHIRDVIRVVTALYP